MTNEDTLLIYTSGKYECKIINPTSNCPFDTTSYFREFNCVVVDIENSTQELYWTLFPNPASGTITLKISKSPLMEPIQIYSAIGCLIRTIIISSTTTKLNIADLSRGLYYMRLKNNKRPALKFIKL